MNSDSLLKSRKQVRVYLGTEVEKDLSSIVEHTGLTETAIASAIVAAGVKTLKREGCSIRIPMQFVLAEAKPK